MSKWELLRSRIHVRFLWFDMWIGAYWARDSKCLYICPLPMCVIELDFEGFLDDFR